MLVALRGDLQDAPDDSLTTIVGDLGLTTDLDYVVYGIDIFNGTKSFVIRDQSFTWLVSAPSSLFYILDPERTEGWVSGQSESEPDRTLIGPSTFCERPAFLEDLADGAQLARDVFSEWRVVHADYSESEGMQRVERLVGTLRASPTRRVSLTFADLGFAFARGWLSGNLAIDLGAYIENHISDARIDWLLALEESDEAAASGSLRASIPPLKSAGSHRSAWTEAFALSSSAGEELAQKL